MKRKIEGGEAHLDWGDKKLTINLNGLETKTIQYLALFGAARLLENRKYPDKAWEEIKAGKREKKKYPLTVQAIAILDNDPIDEIYEHWKKLDRPQRVSLTYRPEVQIQIQQLKIGGK